MYCKHIWAYCTVSRLYCVSHLEPSAISPEHRWSSRYWCRTAGTHDTCPAAAPSLTASSSTCDVATLVHRSLAVTAPAYLSIRRVSLHFICWSVLSALSWLPDMFTLSRTQWLRWTLFCRCRSYSLWNSLPQQLREPDISFNRLKLCWRHLQLASRTRQ